MNISTYLKEKKMNREGGGSSRPKLLVRQGINFILLSHMHTTFFPWPRRAAVRGRVQPQRCCRRGSSAAAEEMGRLGKRLG